MHDENTNPARARGRRLLVGAAILAAIVLIVVLHLTGAVGANSH